MDAKIERWLSREKEGVFYLYEMEMPSGRLARRSLKTRDEIEAKRRFDNPEPYLGPSKTEVVKALRQIVREDQKTGYVYFIKSGDFLKVGYSAAPRERLSSIRTSSPLDCELIGYVPGSAKAERRIHFLLGHAHHRNEWFCATPAILAAIDAVRWRGRVNAK